MINEAYKKIHTFGLEQEKLGNKIMAIVTDRQKFVQPSEDSGFRRDIMQFPECEDLVIKLYNFCDEYFCYKIADSVKIYRHWSGSFYESHPRAESIMVIGMHPMDVELLI
jgi:hypothetical protein